MNLVEHIDGVVPFPEGVYRKDIKADDVTIHTRIGGQGPALVMLHGFGTTGDMWAPVASALVNTHTVIAPDLRPRALFKAVWRLGRENTERRHRARVGRTWR